ncbi:MAG TPA: ECF-type sigma factor [Polyangiaceae bacterium]|nr:ECF-type sigma factor [Polyangiaceae bacterium]
MVAKPMPSPYAQHLGQARVVGLIEGLFPRTLQWADIEDLRQTALVAALRVTRPPATPDEWTALACKIANDTLAEHFRVGATRAKSEVGLCENADDHAANAGAQTDPCMRLDLEKLLDCLHDLVEAGHITARQVGIWTRAVHGVAHTEIAEELGLAHSTVRNEACDARKTLRARWIACAGTAAFFTIAALVWWVARSDGVAGRSRTAPSTAHGSSESPSPPIHRW